MVRVSMASNRKGNLGVFFVRKRTGQIRIIFDTRLLNMLFIDAPSARLPTASSLSGIEVESGAKLYMASGDVSNAF